MTTEAGPETIRVEVVYALPERAWTWALELPRGSSVEQAVLAADVEGRVPGARVERGMLAIHGRTASPTEVLRDGDRVEVLRPLQADPKQARRSRAGVKPPR